MTVPEAAKILGLTRNHAYELARRWRDSDGAEGICVLQFGKRLLVPRTWLEEQAGEPVQLALDPLDAPTPEPPAAQNVDAERTTAEPPTVTRPSVRRRSRRHDTAALQLFPTD